MMEYFIVRGAWRALTLTRRACTKYSALCDAWETEQWLSELHRAEEITNTWDHAAARFHQASDAATLLSTYYRGVPHMLVRSISAAAGLREPKAWVMEMFAEATTCCERLATPLSREPDENNRHRLQVFPLVPAIQCLSFAGNAVRTEICSSITKTLRDTQRHERGYTDSACDQINQIISQVLIEQLVAGPYAWTHFYVTNDVLAALIAPAYGSDSIRQFETGLCFSLQFLAYYRRSLISRNNPPAWAIGQYRKIDQYFSDLTKRSDPVGEDLATWALGIKHHAASANVQAAPHRTLVRQTSAAIVANQYRQQKIPKRLLELCVANNLRAANRSYGLPDEAGRIARIKAFLEDNGITRGLALTAADNWLGRDIANLRRAKEFACLLPKDPRHPTESPAIFAAARDTTIDEIVSRLSHLQRRPDGKDATADAIADWLAKFAHSVNFCQKRRAAQSKEIKQLVQEALQEEDRVDAQF